MSDLSSDIHQTFEHAKALAARRNHTQIGPEHVLVGLLSSTSRAAQVVRGMGLTADIAAAAIDDTKYTSHDPKRFLTSDLEDIMEALEIRAGALASADGDLGIIVLLEAHVPAVDQMFTAVGTSTDRALDALEALVPLGSRLTSSEYARVREQAVSQHPAATHVAVPATLREFGRDLLLEARSGQASTVVGRTAELARMQVVLSRRSKNNPVLVGEPGVGKTAVVTALAHSIVNRTAHPSLLGRPLVSLDLADLVAGARARGDLEQRIKSVLSAAADSNALLVVDDIHSITTLGDGGGMDMANMLKERLARGGLTLIGTSTFEDYRAIEKDPALERRFAPITIGEPTVDQTVEMLGATKRELSAHHPVTFTPDALLAAAELSARHMPDRRLPDKAIDVLDETAARVTLAMSRTTGPVRALYAERAQVRADLGPIVLEEDYETAAELAPVDKDLTARILSHGSDMGTIDRKAVARTIAELTGTPVPDAGGSASLADLPERLARRVLGQDHAVTTVSNVLRRRAVLGAERPSALLFAGATGVGKTELARAVAAEVYGDERAMIRLDMSEFAEKQAASRLFGAPPGYVGYDEGGELTEAVRRRPHSVVLLDEVEKAHPAVFDSLLQVLEDGHLTDSAGVRVDFRNVLLIMTSNLGATTGNSRAAGFGSSSETITTHAVNAAVRDYFRPELLNRLEHIVVFNDLEAAHLGGILNSFLSKTRDALFARGVALEISEAARRALLAAGSSRAMGARPLRRAVVRMVDNAVADLLIAGVPAGSTITIDVDGADLVATLTE